jgi:hypothetical protein
LKTYQCYRVNGYPRVDVKNGAQKTALTPGPSHKAARLSQDFDWGFGGDAADQLAVALLMDIYDNKALALKHYDNVKWTFLATAPRAGTEIREDQVRSLVGASA